MMVKPFKKERRMFIQELARQTPVAGEFDVVVCGGGPAGCAAAVAAAQEGAKTLMLERNQYPGGIWTAGGMPWIIDHQGKTGLMGAWRDALQNMGGRINPPRGTLGVPPEAVKGFLEDQLISAGVSFQYGTMVAAVKKEGRQITHVITESKSGRQAWAGKVFVDCTGDGDTAALAGCGFDFGNASGTPQPASLNAFVCGLALEEVAPFLVPHGKIPLRDLLTELGCPPSYGMPSIFHFGQGIFGWMTHHAYHVKPDDAASVTAAAVAGRQELRRQIGALRNHGGIWKNLALVTTGACLGIREARRIHSLRNISLDDFGKPAEPGVSVCLSSVLPDVHGTDPGITSGIEKQVRELKPCLAIPWQSQIAADCDNLALAGRCIGGDFQSHASYRMTGTAVSLGEAAGRGAAWAAATGKMLFEWDEVPFYEGMKRI